MATAKKKGSRYTAPAPRWCRDLRAFAGYCTTACLDHAEAHALLFADDGQPGVIAAHIGFGDPPERITALGDQLYTAAGEFAGMATRTRWSPDQVTDFSNSWLLVCVQRFEPALFAVGRIPERDWWSLDAQDAPWIALSIAGSLRAAIERDEPLVFKQGIDARLFNTVDQEPPPTDQEGRI